MHRCLEITVPAGSTPRLLRDLEAIDAVIGLSVRRGASVKPPGDVVVVHALNRGLDQVLRCSAYASGRGPLSIATAEVASIIDPDRQDEIDDDVDEAIWEEAETGLRHQGWVTANVLALMVLGGIIATAGLVSGGVPQVIVLVAASIIAPGFEPFAKIPVGLALGRWQVARRGAVSSAVGYAGLIAAAAATFVLLRATE